MIKTIYLIFFLVLLSCTPTQKNDDGEQDNFKFSKDQVGKIEFIEETIEFGDVVIDDERKRFVEIENTGKLPLRYELTFFDGKKFHPSVYYSGNEKTFPGEGGTCPIEIAAGEKCTLAFSFLPIVEKTEQVEVVIQYNNSLNVSSTTTMANAYGGEEADLSMSLSAFDFGFSDRGNYIERTLTITNVGGQHARSLNFNLSQNLDLMGRELFSIVSASTTCPLTNGQLNLGESCNITIGSTINADQEYDDFNGTLIIDYIYDPGSVDVRDVNIDIFQQVVSVEGELKVPGANIGFGDFVNGDIAGQSLFVQNDGFAELSVENVTITGDSGSLSLDITECSERADERLSGTGRLLLDVGESCVFTLIFSPSYPSLPADLSTISIVFDFNDGKNGIRSTAPFGIEAELFAPASLDILLSADPSLEFWNLGATFVANDTRFGQSQQYTIRNTGDVVAQEMTFGLTGSPYFNYTHDCPDVLAKDEECIVTFNFDPSLAIFSANGGLLDITADLSLDYIAGDSDVLGDTKVTTTMIQTSGSIDNLSRIVFSDFDSSTSSTVTSVAGSPAFQDLKIKNVGATQEDNFSPVLTNTTDFFIVDDAGLPFIDGLKNCALHDDGAGTLFSGEECVYRLRAFSGVVGSINTDMSIDFQLGAMSSAAHTVNADFVAPARPALAQPAPASKVIIKSYPTFSYPGEGSNTDINDGSVVTYFNGSDRSVDISNMSFPVLPVTETFDFAYLELGYSPQGTSDQITYSLSNDGSFDMLVRDVAIVNVTNITDAVDVTAMNYFSVDLATTATCAGGAMESSVSPSSSCNNIIDYTLPDEDLYKMSLNIRYTLGNTVSPLSDVLQEYNSVITFYVQGYNATNYAQLNPTAPGSVVSTSELNFSVVAGGENSQQSVVNLINSGAVDATDVHYTLLEAGSFKDIAAINSDLAIVGFSGAGAGLDNYYRLASGQCSLGSANNYQVSENCDVDITFNPQQEGAKDYIFIYRYHNGLTYIEDSFTIKVAGLVPAALIVNNLEGMHPSYDYDFGKQIVNDVHTQIVEVRNTGEVDAVNVNFAAAFAPFSMASSTDVAFPGCGTTIMPAETCYLELNYQPTYSEIEQASQANFNIAWETGVIVAGSPVSDGMIVQGDGFAEERHSQHQGWSSIELAGFNQDYADAIQGIITKPSGNSYGPEELGFIRLKWNPMIDEGAQTYTIQAYAIFKSDDAQFNIHQDTIYDTVIVSGGETEFEYIDNNVSNTPGDVYYYYIVPLRGSSQYVSRVNIDDFPASVIRVAIPHPYMVGMHRFMANMETCRQMNKDVNDVTNINLANNGCIYTDLNSNDIVYDVNYDSHIDMFEASVDYMNGPSFEFTNNPGFPAATATYDEGMTACNNKSITFNTADPILSRNYQKEFPNRREHFMFSKKDTGYTQADCEIVDGEIIIGNQTNCVSDFGLENAAGGLPEWTTGQLSGYGKGVSSQLADGSFESSMVGTDYTFIFSSISTGFNEFRFDDSQNQIDNHCFDVFTGTFSPKIAGVCSGDNLMELTSNSMLETPTRWYLLDTEPVDASLKMLYVGRDISDDESLNIYGLAGGGDYLDSSSPAHNYSPFNTEFTFHAFEDAGFRCSLRLPY